MGHLLEEFIQGDSHGERPLETERGDILGDQFHQTLTFDQLTGRTDCIIKHLLVFVKLWNHSIILAGNSTIIWLCFLKYIKFTDSKLINFFKEY